MRILFIRHGETTGDVENRYGGDYDDHLTEKGRRQAEKLAEKLAGKGIEAIYSSPLLRARGTSEILAKELDCKVVIKPAFKERGLYGILTGMNKDEAKKKYPQLVEKLKDYRNTLEGGESYEDFKMRIHTAVEEIVNDASRACIAVVWHGGPMRVLFREILKQGEIDNVADCGFADIKFQEHHAHITRLEGIRIF